MRTKKTSNPYSTGGGGTNFEKNIQSMFAMFMLFDISIPSLPQLRIEKILLQSKYDEYKTDDCIVFMKNELNKSEAKLLISIKHHVSFTLANSNFSEVINSAWHDYINRKNFNLDTDQIFLVVSTISKQESLDIITMFKWARVCVDEFEFVKKIKAEQFSSKGKRKALEKFRFQLSKAKDGEVTEYELWDFLKHFYVYAFDLDSEMSLTLALILSIISKNCTCPPELIWTKMCDFIANYNQSAGTITKNILESIFHDYLIMSNLSSINDDINKLNEHSRFVLDDMNSNIDGYRIRRSRQLELLDKNIDENDCVFVTGERGCGKSNLVYSYFESFVKDGLVIVLRIEDLNKTNIRDVLDSLSIRSSLSDIEQRFSFYERKYLVIESLERLLEIENKNGFVELLKFFVQQKGWKIVTTVRDYASRVIESNYFSLFSAKITIQDLPNFDSIELKEVVANTPVLENVEKNMQLHNLMHNPFYLKIAYIVNTSNNHIVQSDGYNEFIDKFWKEVVQKDSLRIGGLPLKRQKTFIDIAVSRASSMKYGVSVSGFDSETIHLLENDDLIRLNDNLVYLSHDVFEDWALEKYINNLYLDNQDDPLLFSFKVGFNPAINRAYRFWLHNKIDDNANLLSFIKTTLTSKVINQLWIDETIMAILTGTKTKEYFEKLCDILIADDNSLLVRIMFLLRISCKSIDNFVTRSILTEEELQKGRIMILKPVGKSWSVMIEFLSKNINAISKINYKHVVTFLEEWSQQINVYQEIPKESKNVGLIALSILDEFKTRWQYHEEMTKLFGIMMKVYSTIRIEVDGLFERMLGKKAKQLTIWEREFLDFAVHSIESTYFISENFELFKRMAFKSWFYDDEDDFDRDIPYSNKHIDTSFGLQNIYKFSPASGSRFPFISMFRSNPKNAMMMILELANHCARAYIDSGLDGIDVNNVPKAKIICNDGSEVDQYSSLRLWCLYRGYVTAPSILQSALMALENYLIDLVKSIEKKPDEIDKLFMVIMKNSNSIMTTSVLAAISNCYIGHIMETAVPFIKVSEFYEYDFTRKNNEKNSYIDFSFRLEEYGQFFRREREKSNNYSWRNEDLESLCLKLQFTSLRDQVISIIDDLKISNKSKPDWDFRLKRIDSREFTPEIDEKNNQVIFHSNLLQKHQNLYFNSKYNDSEIYERLSKICIWGEKKSKNEMLDVEYYSSDFNYCSELKELYLILKTNVNYPLFSLFQSGVFKSISYIVRDGLYDVNSAEYQWCKEIIFFELNKLISAENGIPIRSMEINGIPELAGSLPALYCSEQSEVEKSKVLNFMVFCITNDSSSIQKEFAISTNKIMWKFDPKLAQYLLCVYLKFLLWSKNIEFKRIQKNYSKREIKKYRALINNFRKSVLTSDLDFDINTVNLRDFELGQVYISFLYCNAQYDAIVGSFVKNAINRCFSIENGDDDHHEMHNQEKLNIAYEFAEYYLSLQNTSDYITIIRYGCKVAPHFTKLFLIKLDYITENIRRKEMYWSVFAAISNELEELAQKGFTNSFHQNNDGSKLIRSIMYLESNWTKIDFENQNIKYGSECILKFSSKSISNPNVFEGLCSLMHYFPDIFLVEGMSIISTCKIKVVSKHLDFNEHLISILVSVLHKYLILYSSVQLGKSIYNYCLEILNVLVSRASAESYYLREHLLKSKRIHIEANN